jgi:glutathione synthase/RimK-type ligase-like ATP-grasp enzyme
MMTRPEEDTMNHRRVAIHHSPGSFSDRWLDYCKSESIPHAIVDCHERGIISVLSSFDVFLWNWRHFAPQDTLLAPHVIKAAESLGLQVFPNSKTCQSFDNKIAQKYQLEAAGAPLVPTYVFVAEDKALEWAVNTDYPKVFKLARGAGAMNVKLVRSCAQAKSLIRRAFDRGFAPYVGRIREAAARARNRDTRDLCQILHRVAHLPRLLQRGRHLNRQMGRDIGYCYFQDFVPDNDYDTRVTVIGNRAFAFRRRIRTGDFRASGSGLIDYGLDGINRECVVVAFQVARALETQSLALDFVLTSDLRPRIIEISYSYVPDAVYRCPGHWDAHLRWQEGHVWPQDAILDDLLRQPGR